jgi:putative tricarboxylic transport membrane protein
MPLDNNRQAAPRAAARQDRSGRDRMADAPPPRTQGSGPLRSTLDFGGGVFLLALAAVGYIGAFSLPVGHLSGIGSGLMPKVVALLVAAFGAALVIQSLFLEGDRLEQWAVRGPIFVLGGVLVFALTIRTWGLLVAGPLAIVVSALGTRETKPVEVAVLAVTMTLLSGLLFKELLNLPIPFDPAGLVPEPLFRAYVGAKAALGQAVTDLKTMFGR